MAGKRKSTTRPAGTKGGRKRTPSKGGGETARPRRLFVPLLRWTLVAAIWSGVALAGLIAWYAYDLPDLETLETPARRPSVTFLASDGSVLATYGDLYGGPVGFNALPPHLVQAVVATEDRRFFAHPGFDALGVLRAAWINLRAGAIRQGGSTITQQLAKNLFLTPTRSLRRKVQEMLLAFWLEARFSKQQIFSIYINRVYLGAGTYGVEAASQRYFGISVRDANIFQAAVLAGLLKAPSRFAPTRNPKGAKRRAVLVLDRMVKQGFLSPAQAREAAQTDAGLQRAARGGSSRYFTDWLLERATGNVGHSDRDLVIVTTLDARLQRLAAGKLTALLKASGRRAAVSQGALVALSPGGAIRAMVGGRDYAASQFNRVTQALRQPGSAFKLFVYLAGLEAGMSPDDAVTDGPLQINGWRPRNYDGRYRGAITLRRALALSVNTVAVRISERAGRRQVIDAARRLGIGTKLRSHPSLALGAGEVTLLGLTAAYGVLANRGRAVWPHGIAEIRDGKGRVIYRRTGSGGGQVIAPRRVGQLTAMLEEVIATGTGRAAALDRPAAGKTGTSQDSRDAWFIGFTAELVTGVWLGNDDFRPMKRVTGGGLPARLWRSFMADALHGLPRQPLPGG